jgi:hypothetical protein
MAFHEGRRRHDAFTNFVRLIKSSPSSEPWQREFAREFVFWMEQVYLNVHPSGMTVQPSALQAVSRESLRYWRVMLDLANRASAIQGGGKRKIDEISKSSDVLSEEDILNLGKDDRDCARVLALQGKPVTLASIASMREMYQLLQMQQKNGDTLDKQQKKLAEDMEFMKVAAENAEKHVEGTARGRLAWQRIMAVVGGEERMKDAFDHPPEDTPEMIARREELDRIMAESDPSLQKYRDGPTDEEIEEIKRSNAEDVAKFRRREERIRRGIVDDEGPDEEGEGDLGESKGVDEGSNEEDNCAVCETFIPEGEEVGCSACLRWFHATQECAGIEVVPMDDWICDECSDHITGHRELLKSVEGGNIKAAIRESAMVDELRLKDHQFGAVSRFFERDSRLSILAHVMGTGKTLTAITIAMLSLGAVPELDLGLLKSHKKAMFVVPKVVNTQWMVEIYKWTQVPDGSVMVIDSTPPTATKRQKMIDRFSETNIVIITHSMFRNMWGNQSKEGAANSSWFMDKRVNWSFVAVDESHVARNKENKLTKSLLGFRERFESTRILALTGTPAYNRVEDVIVQCGWSARGPRWLDDTIKTIRAAKKNSGVLQEAVKDVVEAHVDIAGDDVLGLMDPIIKNHDMAPLDEEADKRYRACVTELANTIKKLSGTNGRAAHGLQQKMGKWRGKSVAGMLQPDSMLPIDDVNGRLYCGQVIPTEDGSYRCAPPLQYADQKDGRRLKTQAELDAEVKWWLEHRAPDFVPPKYTATFNLVREAWGMKEKTIVFSSRVVILHQLRAFMVQEMARCGMGAAEALQNQVLVVTGSTSIEDRDRAFQRVQDPEDDARVILLTYAVASVGVNLTGTTVQVHMDQPSNMEVLQAIARSRRLGQTKQVTVHFLFGTRTARTGEGVPPELEGSPRMWKSIDHAFAIQQSGLRRAVSDAMGGLIMNHETSDTDDVNTLLGSLVATHEFVNIKNYVSKKKSSKRARTDPALADPVEPVIVDLTSGAEESKMEMDAPVVVSDTEESTMDFIVEGDGEEGKDRVHERVFEAIERRVEEIFAEIVNTTPEKTDKLYEESSLLAEDKETLNKNPIMPPITSFKSQTVRTLLESTAASSGGGGGGGGGSSDGWTYAR